MHHETLLTTKEVSERMGVAVGTVTAWCREGRFSNARAEQTSRGPVWVIPEGDLAKFVRPKRGRRNIDLGEEKV